MAHTASGWPEGTAMFPVVDAVVVTGANGRGATAVSLQHGLVVEPGVILCVADVNFGSPNATAQVRGHLAEDR